MITDQVLLIRLSPPTEAVNVLTRQLINFPTKSLPSPPSLEPPLFHNKKKATPNQHILFEIPLKHSVPDPVTP